MSSSYPVGRSVTLSDFHSVVRELPFMIAKIWNNFFNIVNDPPPPPVLPNPIAALLCVFICAPVDLVINGSMCCIPDFQFPKEDPNSDDVLKRISKRILFTHDFPTLTRLPKKSFKLPDTLI